MTIPRSLLLLLLPLIPAAAAKDPDPLEAEVAALEAADRASPPPAGAVLFLGSSSIRGWDLAKSFPGRAVVNRGFGGSTYPDATRFLDRLVTPHRPKVVVLYSGDNDLKSGRTADRVVADWKALVAALRKAVPDVKVVTIGIKPSPDRWSLVEEARRANAAIREAAAADAGQRFVAVEAAMLGKDGKPRPELYQRDGLHLSRAGYEVWTKLVTAALDDLAGEGAQGGEQGLQALVGKTLEEAQAWLKANPTPSPEHPGTNVTMVRPIRIDGEDLALTMDLRGDRVNVVVEGGKISAVDGVY